MDLEIRVISEKPVRNEIWNLKCEESQQAFKKQTSETNKFSNCFENKLPVIKQIENWKKVLNERRTAAYSSTIFNIDTWWSNCKECDWYKSDQILPEARL